MPYESYPYQQYYTPMQYTTTSTTFTQPLYQLYTPITTTGNTNLFTTNLTYNGYGRYQPVFTGNSYQEEVWAEWTRLPRFSGPFEDRAQQERRDSAPYAGTHLVGRVPLR